MKKRSILLSISLLGLWIGLSSFNLWPVKKFSYTIQDNPAGGSTMNVTLKGWNTGFEKEYQKVETLEELKDLAEKSGFKDDISLLEQNISLQWKLEKLDIVSVSHISSKAEFKFVRK